MPEPTQEHNFRNETCSLKKMHFGGMFGYQEHQKQIRGVKQIAFEFGPEIFQDDIKEHLLLP